VPVLFINTSATHQELLDSWLHEGLHVAKPRMSEAEVREVAGFLTELLWKAGYRHPEDRKH
jgi:hypothetical protein